MATRRYRSPLRAEQARRTRRKIRQAARACFEETGFVGATVEEIATRAQVSPATVYATFETKAGIVASMFEVMEEDAGLPARSVEILEEPDPRRQLELFVATNRDLFERGQSILRAAMDARSTPAVAALMAAGDANRRSGVDALVPGWHRAGVLRGDLGEREAIETMWLLTSVEEYLLCVDQLGWSGDRYERWLVDLLGLVLLGDDAVAGADGARP